MTGTAEKKLQIRFTDEAYRQVDELCKKSGARNKADLIRSAIALYEVYVDNVINNGWEMQLVKNDKIKTLIPIKT